MENQRRGGLMQRVIAEEKTFKNQKLDALDCEQRIVGPTIEAGHGRIVLP